MVLARWQRTIVDSAGNVLPGVTVTVKRETGGALLAAIYSDRDGLIPMTNPITTNTDGIAAFHVANGVYRIDAVYGGYSETWRYVGISTAAESGAFLSGVGFLVASATVDADPGTGCVAFNNVSPANATMLYISTFDSSGLDVSAWLDLMDDFGSVTNRGVIVLRSSDGTTEFQAVVTESITIATGYRKIAITVLAASTAFIPGSELGAMYMSRGIDGLDGEMTGPGAAVTAGQLAMFANGAGATVAGAAVAEGSPTDPLIAGTAAGVRAGAPGHVIDAGLLRSAAVEVALSDAALVAMNWEAGINFSLTMAGNRTLDIPSNGIPGTWRTIYVTSDGASARTLTFAVGFAGSQASLTDITNAKTYLLTLYCRSQGQILVAATDMSP